MGQSSDFVKVILIRTQLSFSLHVFFFIFNCHNVFRNPKTPLCILRVRYANCFEAWIHLDGALGQTTYHKKAKRCEGMFI